MSDFKPLDFEPKILAFWNANEIYPKVQEKNKGKQKFYFLDGPPYTSGKVHIGTAWNKSMKDLILRYKRMQGFDVTARAGYDMHGLPTENATEKKLGLKSKEEIPKMGVDKFVKACKELSISNLKQMNEDFIRLGVWMDFENAYQTVSNDYIDGEWWLVKTANEKGRLYEGFRAMAWDWVHQTAVAKHELEYKTVEDVSIFVKMQVKGKENEYFVIWTTTPWTIPFNLGIMVNPEFDYVKCKIDNDGKEEYWILAKKLANVFLSSVVGTSFEIVEEMKGEQLEGSEYIHPFYNELSAHYEALKKDHPNVHTVVLSSEFVDTTAGSGLVHMAPGCGPEDYEIGYRNNIPAWNLVKEDGVFSDEMGAFSGRHAVHDNYTFVESLRESGNLVAETPIEHEYPHGQRSHEKVIFRTTKQWFFKVEDLKEKMIKENDKIDWVPEAGYNAFNSWLKNLRDNSISKQRYWGTPLPVWRNVENESDYIVVGSIAELEKLSGQKVTEPHIPFIDDITIEKDGKTYKRVPDVLDVWVDAGTASWNSLYFPKEKESFDKLFPADFILEGKDQIRGWFNLLHIASMVAFEKPCFKAVYMHGYVQDAQGRKMSKSEGNYILPSEVISKLGADVLRYYMIGGGNAGVDINYNFSDLDVKYKNLIVLWNVHKFLLDMASSYNLGKADLKISHSKSGVEEKYILSKLHSTLFKITKLFDAFKLDEVPTPIEQLFLELSRTYMQFTRDKVAMGTVAERKVVFSTLYTVLFETLKMLAPVVPFTTEAIYQNLKEAFDLPDESIHLFSWTKADEKLIDTKLEVATDLAGSVIQAALAAREKAQLGVRWPATSITLVTQDNDVKAAVKKLESVIINQLNVKAVLVLDVLAGVTSSIDVDYARLGRVAGQDTQAAAAAIRGLSPDTLLTTIADKGSYTLKIGDKSYQITKDQLKISRNVPERYKEGESRAGLVYLDTELTPELEAEGFAREIARRVQSLRKDAELEKTDEIDLCVQLDDVSKDVEKYFLAQKTKLGAKKIDFVMAVPKMKFEHSAKATVKGKSFVVYFNKRK